MITFYQCLQEYEKMPSSFRFNKKQLKRISGYVAHIYDSNENNPPVTYVQQQEGAEKYRVRSYPYAFKRFIIGLFIKAGNIERSKEMKKSIQEIKVKGNILIANEDFDVIKAVGNQIECAPFPYSKSKRNRIPLAKKPEFSVKFKSK